MQEEANEHNVSVELRVERQHPLSHTKQLQRVLKQTTNPRMVHTHRSGCLAHACHEWLV